MRARLVVCALLAACAVPSAALAAPGLLIGVDDDGVKWLTRAQQQTSVGYMRDLGVRAIRITVPWRPGQTHLSVVDRRPVDRAILATWGMRVVLAVYGKPDDAPRDAVARDQFCRFVAWLLHRYPAVQDVVIWNEPNLSRFWRPQFTPDGLSAAPAAYQALLAQCYDVLHSSRPGVNVIAASAPRGNDRPSAKYASHSPGNFYRKIGEAYRVSGRRRPLFDTVGHNPYPNTNAERPWTRHPNSSAIGQGDYDKLMAALTDAFATTAQPLPGTGRVAIWYMEQGFQTVVDPAKRAHYRGAETDKQALPPVAGRTTADADARAADQATQLRDALHLAYCQPAVAAFFNFELADETVLGGWQSGLLWADLTPKPSYLAFKSAVAEVRAGRVDCKRFEPKPAPAKKPSDEKDEKGPQIGFTPGKTKP